MEQNIKCQSKILNPAIISYTNEDEIKTKNKQNQTYTTRNGSSSGLRKKMTPNNNVHLQKEECWKLYVCINVKKYFPLLLMSFK